MPATDARPHPTPPSCCRESKEQALGASFRSEEHEDAIGEGPPTPLTEGRSGPRTLPEERARRQAETRHQGCAQRNFRSIRRNLSAQF